MTDEHHEYDHDHSESPPGWPQGVPMPAPPTPEEIEKARKEIRARKITRGGFSLLLGPPYFLIMGWACHLVWRWFFVRPFGLREVPIGCMIGLLLMHAAVAKTPSIDDVEHETQHLIGDSAGTFYAREVARSIGRPLFFLGMAWVWKLALGL